MKQSKDLGRKSRERPKHKLRQRILRWMLFGALSFCVLLLALFIAFYLCFPLDKLKQIAQDSVRQSLARQLSIGQVSLNLFRGFEFHQIRLEPLHDSLFVADAFPIKQVTAKKAILRYSLKDLLRKRHFTIYHAEIDSVCLDLMIDTSLLPPANAEPTATTPASLDSIILPVSIALQSLRLNNTVLHVTTQDSILTQQFSIGDLDLALNEVSVPRGGLVQNDSLLHGRLLLACVNTHFTFQQTIQSQKQLELNSTLNFVADVQLNGLKDISLKGQLGLADIELFSITLPLGMQAYRAAFPIELSLLGQVNYFEQLAQLQSLALRVDKQNWLVIGGSVSEFLTKPKIDLFAQDGRVPIHQLFTLVRPFLADTPLSKMVFYPHDVALKFSHLTLRGTVPDSTSVEGLEFTTKLLLANLKVHLGDAVDIQGLSANVSSSGELLLASIQNLRASVNLALDSLSYQLDDTTRFYTGKSHFNISAILDPKMVPTSASFKANIDNIMGAQLASEVTVKAQGGLNDIRGTGYAALTGLDASHFPNSVLQTTAQARLDLGINTLDSLLFKLKIETDSLAMPQELERVTFPPIDFSANLHVGCDTTFQRFVIKDLTLRLNELARAKALGQVELIDKDTRFALQMPELAITNPALLSWIPSNMRSQFEDVLLTGRILMNAQTSGLIGPDKIQYHATAHLRSEATSMRYPAMFLAVNGIHLDAHADISAVSGGNVRIALEIDSTAIENVSERPFRKNKARLCLKSPDFLSFQIDSGEIALPDFHINGHFEAVAYEIMDNLNASAKIEIVHATEDTMRILPGITIKGWNKLTANVQMDTATIAILSDLEMKNLSLFLPQQTVIKNLNADLTLRQKFNYLTGTFLGRSDSPLVTPTETSIDYLLYRTYYRSNLPNLSFLSIDEIIAAGYALKNFTLEAYLGDGRVEIPSFNADLYGGNIGGRLNLNLADGDLEKANYHIYTHFSGVNSALLLPQASTKEDQGIINANAELSGQGLDPEKGIGIGGHFYITEIGPKVADNFLRSLDPQGIDSGIRTTRMLINRGFKPKLFSFEIRHGYFYPAILFSQPWYFPVRLSGGRVELSRIPVDFFVQNALRQAAQRAEQ